jgi:hypothetical protein
MPTRHFPQNCFEWALDLCHELAHWVGEWGLPELFAGSKFVQALVPWLVPVSESAAIEGDLVVYFNGELPTHAGLIKHPPSFRNGERDTYTSMAYSRFHRATVTRFNFFGKPPAGVVTTRFVEYVRHHPDFVAIDTLRKEFQEKFRDLYNNG